MAGPTLQGALFLKIVRGRLDFSAVRGYSAELVDHVKRCLTRNTSRRPDASGLLKLPSLLHWADTLDIAIPGRAPTSSRGARTGATSARAAPTAAAAALAHMEPPPGGGLSPVKEGKKVGTWGC
eukprot:897886-Pyramimonas_sp.AAC.1